LFDVVALFQSAAGMFLMRKPIASAAAIKEASDLVHAPTRLVCLALGMSILMLAIRIASIW
jgi:hypothetical protein